MLERLAEKIMLSWGWRRALIAFAAGLLSVLALAPVNFFVIMFVSVSVLVWLIDGASGKADAGMVGRLRPAFVTGWWFGFGYFTGGLFWLGNALLIEADQFAWALPLAVFGLPAFLALFYGAATALARLFWSDGFGRIAVLAAAFGLIEFARQFLLTGFPWNAIGYTIAPIPVMMQTASIFGIDGLNILAVFVFAAPALIGTRRGMLPGIALAAILFFGNIGYGFYILRTPKMMPPDDMVIRIVQPNIDQSLKWQPEDREAIFLDLLKLTARPSVDSEKRPDIIIWPETAIPFLLTDNPAALLQIADTLETGQTLVTGAVRAEGERGGPDTRYYNAIYVIDDKGEIVAASDKSHLVPFGEYLPLEFLLSRLGLETVAQSFGGFSAAASRSLLSLPGGLTVLPLICYEAIFPSMMEIKGQSGDLLLNVTNDDWFGLSPGPYQHLRQAQLRSVETRLPLLRAANSGISAVIAPDGSLNQLLSLGEKGVIDTLIPEAMVAKTTYAKRELNFWLFFAIMVLLGIFSRFGKRRGCD